MDTKNWFLRWSFLTLLGVVLTFSLATCTFCPPTLPGESLCSDLLNAPLKDLALSGGPDVIFEEPGTIITYHGFGCAESNKSGEEDVLKVEQSLDLPAYVNKATVLLNGWRVKYLSKDHEVTGLGTMIGDIRLEGNTLKWQAAGVLSDQNFDDGYRWCYYYTVLGWNSSNLILSVDHEDCDTTGDPIQANFFATDNDGTTTALSSFPSFLQNSSFIKSHGRAAILPRGFGFSWPSRCPADSEDHHLLEVAYNLVHSENFIQNDKKYKKELEDVVPSLPNSASQVNFGFVSWETSAIFKDNKARRDYEFAEIVSGLAGDDVGVIQPPFSILPVEDENFCTDIGPSPITQEFIIERIPFEFAIPMLTGWRLNYGCEGDQQITEAGIWIDEWQYDKNTRTLRYRLSSSLRDRDSEPPYSRDHKVTILGLRPIGP